jgi:catechol 2,3-dioxygenase-like lactoylglutathione lyase family enzyme
VAAIHHVELWVPDLSSSRPRWAWVFERLGWQDFQDWPGGHSWQAPDGAYVVIEQSPDMTSETHDRLRPGMNHLAVTAPSVAVVDEIAADCAGHGWTLMFADRHPHAGGPDHYAAFIADDDGYELEIVAPE